MEQHIKNLNEAFAFLKDHFGILEDLNIIINATEDPYGMHDGREVLVGKVFYEIGSGHPRGQYETDDYHCFFLKTSETTEKLFILRTANKLSDAEVNKIWVDQQPKKDIRLTR